MCCLYCVVFCRYTGTTPTPPPGSHYSSPSENMWNTGGTYSMSQGMGVSGTSAHVYITRKHLVSVTNLVFYQLQKGHAALVLAAH